MTLGMALLIFGGYVALLLIPIPIILIVAIMRRLWI